MSTNLQENDEQRARLTRALVALKDLRSQLNELRRAQAEPIAIVGLGCRFPGGADDPGGFWRLLQNQEDAIREVPPERWDVDAYYAADPEAAGKICTRYGGFLEGVDQFDAHFFGIAPCEAASLDPQQRLLLEVAWEALEHAGLAPDRLRGSRTGVFAGISSNEYAHLLLSGGPHRIDAYLGSGNAHSVAAGRLSYVFGFEGPSLAVDTACSSSLVTVHLACQSIRLGECDLALAGGVNLLLTPTISINHSRARMLAPDGRCKTFDAAADGFVRSEGCGLVVLKRLSAALAEGDPILALIRGSEVNQDGHTSGLTVPNGPSQQAVMRQALARAGLSPAAVSYVEAHGTGTALGDPIELQALAAVFGGERPAERPLVVGSVKSNIGHAEAAAGIAGLIKVVLALRHETIPANLHFHRPNPRVAWDHSPVIVPRAALPWPKGPEPRVAGVSSFGFGGTNAHVVVSEPPAPAPRPAAPERPLHLLALSAQSGEALKALATRYATYLGAHPEPALGDVCHTVNAGRAHFRHRLGVTAGSVVELRTRLGAFAAGAETAGLAEGKANPARPPLVGFLFTGQGAQYAGMGRELYETEPGFRRHLGLCDELLRPYQDRPLLEVLHAADGALDETAYIQPALFALEYCLGRLWMAWGVVPDVLMGHSLGEYVAACLAGVFSLEDGIRLIATRARLMQKLPDNGAMAAVFAGEAEVRSALAALAPDLDVAAINGPEHVVVSGRRAGLDRVVEHFARQGVETRPLKVSQAFHSALVEPMLEEFERVAGEVSFAPPRLEIVSNLTGAGAGAELAEPGYWRRHARQPVRFWDGMRALEEQGVGVFLEIGPHPVLLGMGRRCVSRPAPMWLPSLKRGQGEWQAMLDTLAALYVRGVPVDWRGFDAGYGRRRVPLPTYPFQRQRYWAVPEEAGGARLRLPASGHPRPHALLGARWRHACRPDDILFETELGAGQPAFLDDHRVFGTAIMPASGYMDMALAAAPVPERMSLENLGFHRPLAFREGETRIVQTCLRQDPQGGYALHIHSRSGEAEGEPAWTLHASGTLRVEAAADAGPRQDLAALRGRMAETAPGALYEAYARHGVAFGPALRAVRQLWRAEGEALARIAVPPEHGETYWLHPVWLDACAQVVGAAAPETGVTYLQARVGRVRVYRRPAAPAWSHARVRPGMDGAVRIADVRLLDDAGEVLAEVSGLEARPADAASLRPEGLALYQLRWLPQPRAAASGDFLPSPGTIAAALGPRLDEALADSRLLAYGDALAGLDALALFYVADAFRQLGWTYQTGQRFSTSEVLDALRIVPQHGRLLERLLAILAGRGTLRRADPDWEVAADLPADDATRRFAAAAEKYAVARAELEMLDRCGSRLGEVLRGRCDPVQLLFPDGELASVAAIYEASPGAVAMHGLLRHAVAGLRETWPAGRPLRVLEVGAGTGGATAYVLPELPPGTAYLFTDISRGFLAGARARFVAYPFVRYGILDIEQSADEQGYAGREFDLVIAYNVIHATRSLRETMAHVHRLLAPGGLLLLLENTSPAEWVDLIWGLTPGWWRFTDYEVRPSYPLLDTGQWRAFLTANGFASAESIAADPECHEVLARQALVVARKAGSELAQAADRKQTWLILADAGGFGEELAELLEVRGHRAVRAYRGVAFAQMSADVFGLDPVGQEDFRRLLAELCGAGGAPLHAILHLWGLDSAAADSWTAADLRGDSVALSGSALRLAQALAAAGLEQPPALWLATRGALPVGEMSRPPALKQAALWGTGKVIAREYPGFWGGMLDLDPAPPPGEGARLLDELCFPDGEDHLAFRGGERYAARIVPCDPVPEHAVPVRGDAIYLITGGLGALGLETARWLVDQGARRLALIGRSGAATDAARRAVAELEQRGVKVDVFRADVADEAAMGQVFAALRAAGLSLRGVVHAAGIPGRRAIAELEPADLDRMFAAKVAGAWVLHQLAREWNPDFFACFSSMVSLWGAREQCHYVAANHVLDLLVHYRRALGLPALAVNWGPLEGGGMLPPEEVAELKRIGVAATPMRRAVRVLTDLLGSEVAQAAPVDIAWPLFRSLYQSRGRCSLFDLVAVGAAARPEPPAETGIRERLGGTPESERREILGAHVQAVLGRVLGLEAGRLPDRQQGFFDMGMDSLTAMELRTKLQASLAVSLPATLAFDYGTVDTLADYLLRDALDPAPSAPAADARETGGQGESSREMIERMSDEEVEILLQAKLSSL